jgi:hypothetical protein
MTPTTALAGPLTRVHGENHPTLTLIICCTQERECDNKGRGSELRERCIFMPFFLATYPHIRLWFFTLNSIHLGSKNSNYYFCESDFKT